MAANTRSEPDCTGRCTWLHNFGCDSIAVTISAVKPRGCDVVNRTRRIPGTSATASSKSEKRTLLCEGSAYEFTVCPSNCTSEYPRSARWRTSLTIEALARLRSGPRVYGTTQ